MYKLFFDNFFMDYSLDFKISNFVEYFIVFLGSIKFFDVW